MEFQSNLAPYVLRSLRLAAANALEVGCKASLHLTQHYIHKQLGKLFGHERTH